MQTHGFEFGTGMVLLEVPSPRSTIGHRLACARLAEMTGHDTVGRKANATAYWIDARNAAAPRILSECATSPRHLESLQVARAFTAYQHHSLVRKVTHRVDASTELLVSPNVASLYHDADLPEWEREDLLAASLETLAELGRVLECPVLVTSAVDEHADTIAKYATTRIECVHTREGIRLEAAHSDRGSDANGGAGRDEGLTIDETAGYWHEEYWQTTIPYWVECYGAVDEVRSVVDAHDRGLLEVTP
ncbi:hypothetical protein [Natronorubrum sediminis]|nr:hypothetical protein [Natronorubrum sediminis]